MTENSALNLAKNLQIYMQTNHLTLNELAQKLGEATSTVHGWLNGIPPKNIITIKRVADTLEMTMDELCFERRNHSKRLATDLIIKVGDKSFKILLDPID